MKDYHSTDLALEEVKRAIRYALKQIAKLNIPKSETKISMSELHNAKRLMEKRLALGLIYDYEKGKFMKIAKRFDH